ncbi:MAG: M56 family metallopeptidase, partial [Kordia sp.]
MIVYFIQVVAFQLLFLLSYDLFLKKETFFNWNRVYLIFSSLISFLLPFIKIESFQNVVPQEYIILLPEIVLTPQKAVAAIEPTWNWFLIIG